MKRRFKFFDPRTPPLQNLQFLNKKLGKNSKHEKHEKAAFWTLTEKKCGSCPNNMTLPPVFVVEQHEKHVLKPLKSDRAAKRPIFTHFKADFRAQNGQQGLPGIMAENWVIRVKKSTFGILTREVILEVGDAEKRVLAHF